METEKPEVRYVDKLTVLPAKGRCSKGRKFSRKLLWQLAYHIGDAFCHKGFPMAVPLEEAYKASLEREYPERQIGILISIHFLGDRGPETDIQVKVVNWDDWLRRFRKGGGLEGEGDRQRRIKQDQDLALGEKADIAILISGEVKYGAKLVNSWTSEKVRKYKKDYKPSRTLLISRRLYTLRRIGALKDFEIMDKDPSIHVCEDQGDALFSILSHFFGFSFMDMRD